MHSTVTVRVVYIGMTEEMQAPARMLQMCIMFKVACKLVKMDYMKKIHSQIVLLFVKQNASVVDGLFSNHFCGGGD